MLQNKSQRRRRRTNPVLVSSWGRLSIIVYTKSTAWRVGGCRFLLESPCKAVVANATLVLVLLLTLRVDRQRLAC